MKKKTILALILVAFSFIFLSFSAVLANTAEDAVNGVRDMAGGAENVM